MSFVINPYFNTTNQCLKIDMTCSWKKFRAVGREVFTYAGCVEEKLGDC
jgi:hypothetical protein